MTLCAEIVRLHHAEWKIESKENEEQNYDLVFFGGRRMKKGIRIFDDCGGRFSFAGVQWVPNIVNQMQEKRI